MHDSPTTQQPPARWRVLGASVVGASHVGRGLPCQDAHDWAEFENGLSCFCVADGAGSHPRSAEGSRITVAAALAVVESLGEAGDAHDLGVAVVTEARRRIAEIADAEGVAEHDFASTLALVVASGDSLLVAQVGDCIVATVGPSGATIVDPAPRAEYANETSFVTGATALADLRVAQIDGSGVEAVAMSSDGLRLRILDIAGGGVHEPFFADLVRFAKSDGASSDAIERFLERVDDRTGDDKTLLVAVRSEEQASPDAAVADGPGVSGGEQAPS